jgi:transglutaminase-like putative cysteine protease
MLIRFGFDISVTCAAPVPALLALSPHSTVAGRMVGTAWPQTEPSGSTGSYLDRFGNRIHRLELPTGLSRIWSDAVVEVDGHPDARHVDATQHPVSSLPPETLSYLLPSRFCESDRVASFAWQMFGSTPEGWPRAQAVCDFVHNHITFGYGFGNPLKSAADVLADGKGVCRDFAHLAIALCRSLNLPARYASGYLGDVGVPYAGPGDFCAWFEVFLGGQWQTFDARYNRPRAGRVLMVRGHDAADVAMITNFGNITLTSFRVWTDEIPPGTSEDDIAAMLRAPPPVDPRDKDWLRYHAA